MLDVLHYLLDEDMSYASAEQMDAKMSLRKTMYQDMYNKKYLYAPDSRSANPSYSDFEDEQFPVPFDVNELKPYVPPTDFDAEASNPFQGVLREAPLG